MPGRIKGLLPHLMAGFMALIFLDSLLYKFTNAAKTQVIFGALDAWAARWGAPGLFAQTGLFSQYVIGAIELTASVLLLAGMIPGYRRLQAMGALAGLLVMTGAVSFHLFTPLGIDPNRDGGGLFAAACTNLVFAALLLCLFRRRELFDFAGRFFALFTPAPM